MTLARPSLLALTLSSALAACGGQETGPPRHPVAEIGARAGAKLELVDLVVSDPVRAERVRHVYLSLVALGTEFDLARARSMLAERAAAEQRSTQQGQITPASVDNLEQLLAPPLAEGKAFFGRYAALMLEARGLLTEDEFEKLDRVR